jgi:hypothetical protein
VTKQRIVFTQALAFGVGMMFASYTVSTVPNWPTRIMFMAAALAMYTAGGFFPRWERT